VKKKLVFPKGKQSAERRFELESVVKEYGKVPGKKGAAVYGHSL
jgi:hypothetical protein